MILLTSVELGYQSKNFISQHKPEMVAMFFNEVINFLQNK